MSEAPRPSRRWLLWAAAGIVALLAVATVAFWEDIRRTALDPRIPFQTYRPPPAPDYARRDAWALAPAEPARATAAEPAVDVFFVGPTTYDGGEHWNAPVAEPRAERIFRRVMAPNHAGPYVRVGRLFAPRYRQASLYSLLTLREDARDARRFAYGDVRQAFRAFLTHYNQGRPFLLVGVEQGGTLAARLLAEEVGPNPAVRDRLVAAYLAETIIAAAGTAVPPCQEAGQTGCVAAWASVYEGQDERARMIRDRALIWTETGELQNLEGWESLCFNPVLGAVTSEAAPARLHRGAANATGLEWDARPAFMARQVSARCEEGILRVSRPKSASLRRSGSWADRRRTPGFNLFYADLEADAAARTTALLNRRPEAVLPDASRTGPAEP